MKPTTNNLFVGVFLFASAAGFINPDQRAAGESVHFIQVGQGDATLIRSSGWVVMIDVGQRNDFFDAGKRIVGPYLQAEGVRAIDLLLVSHPDKDHIGGLAAVAARIPVRNVGIADVFRDDQQLLDTLEESNLLDRTIWLNAPSKIFLGNSMLYLEPRSELNASNDRSLYAHWRSHQGATVAFCGDATSAREDELIRLDVPRASLLKASHHGARDGNSRSWIRYHAPGRVVVSVGRNNRYGHPDREVLARLSLERVEVSRTDFEGHVVFRPSGASWVRVSH